MTCLTSSRPCSAFDHGAGIPDNGPVPGGSAAGTGGEAGKSGGGFAADPGRHGGGSAGSDGPYRRVSRLFGGVEPA